MSTAIEHTALTHALNMARVGYYLAPVNLRRGPDGKKRPTYHGSWDQQSTNDPEQLKYWYFEHTCSFLVDCGKSGIVGVDLDLGQDRDGIAAWQAQQGPHGGIIVDTLSGGQHHYFAADPNRPLANSTDATTGIDVRAMGGHLYAPGAFIVGVNGEVEDGIYAARGPLYTPGDLPEAPEILHLARKATSPNAGLPREDRSFTLAQAREYCQVKLRELTDATEGGRNHALNTAGFRLGHFVADHFGTTYAAAETALRKALPAGYGSAPGEQGEIAATIRSSLTDGIEDGVYVRSEAESGSAYDEEDPAVRRARLVAERVERLEIDTEARQLISVATAPPLLVMRGAAFLDGDDLEYLVRGLFYFSSTSKIYGPPGGGKTNFALDVALCAATGIPWRGEHKLPRTRVHFVMAEGESVNRLRVKAFLHKHGLEPDALDGWFTAIPQGVLLTPEGIRAYLQVVRDERPGMVFLDTKNAMMDGDENSASDVAVMIRAMREIRDAGQRCAVVLIDHTGLADETRGRGSNAVMAAMDTEVRVSKDASGGAVVFTATVTRDKAAPEARASFPFTLWPQDIPRPDGVAAPPVVVVDDVALSATVERGARAEDVTAIEPPANVVNYGGEGHQAIVEVAVICMRHGRGSTGVSLAAVKAYYRAENPKMVTDTANRRVARAWDALYGLGRLTPVIDGSQVKTGASFWVEDRPSEVD